MKTLKRWLYKLAAKLNPVSLDNKTIIIVGATGGIGRVLSKVFHELGANVVLASRTIEKLNELQSSLGEDRVLVVATDATSVGDVKNLFKKSKERFGTIDGVVISAGTWERLSIDNTIEEAGESADRMYKSIYLPTLTVGKAAQEFFCKQGYGLIANISSHAAVRPWLKGNLTYAAMKAAARQLMLALRHELLETDVHVVDIQPAIVNTPESAHLLNTGPKRKAAVQPEAIANWIADLLGKRRVPAEKLFDSDVKLD